MNRQEALNEAIGKLRDHSNDFHETGIIHDLHHVMLAEQDDTTLVALIEDWEDYLVVVSVYVLPDYWGLGQADGNKSTGYGHSHSRRDSIMRLIKSRQAEEWIYQYRYPYQPSPKAEPVTYKAPLPGFAHIVSELLNTSGYTGWKGQLSRDPLQYWKAMRFVEVGLADAINDDAPDDVINRLARLHNDMEEFAAYNDIEDPEQKDEGLTDREFAMLVQFRMDNRNMTVTEAIASVLKDGRLALVKID